MARYIVKKCNAIYQTRELTTLFTRARLLPISSATGYGIKPSQLFLKIHFISIKFQHIQQFPPVFHISFILVTSAIFPILCDLIIVFLCGEKQTS
jgi:hypothetical protein